MEKKKRLIINLISNIISFVLQLGISFILTPIITEKVGTAAYGFIGLSNNFISYANIFTVIINSMASRFITYEITKGNMEKANKYYSSVFFMNIIMSSIIVVFSTIFIININNLLDIPIELEKDVKITFIFAFINLVLSIMSTIFTIATYVKDRLDLEAVRNIIGNIIKAIFLIIVFSLLEPKIYYITIGGVIFTLFVLLANIRLTKVLMPQLKINIKNFDKSAIWTLIKSGIWNSINNLSRVLLTGLDLLIANLFIGADAMGLLSIAKTIPTTIENLLCTIANIFSPRFIILYSKRKIRELVQEINFSTKIIAFIMIVPISGFIVFGREFFTLWLANENAENINKILILSILSLAPYVVSVSNYSLFILDTVTNKLKRPVIATLIMSTLSTITTITLLKFTDLGIYAVAGVSSIYWILKVILFNNINAAKNLRIKWNAFLGQFLKNTVCLIMIMIIFEILKKPLILNTWKTFIFSVGIVAIIGYLLSFVILFSKEEKQNVIRTIKSKIMKGSER